MKVLILIASMLLAFTARASDVPIEELRFPDQQLQKCVLAMAQQQHIHSSRDMEYLQCAFEGNVSLAGIKQLPELKSLVLSGGEINDLPALNHIPALRDILLSRVNLSKVDKLNKPDLDVVFSRVTLNDWRDLAKVHVSTIAIKSPGSCSQYRPLMRDKRVALVIKGASDKQISQGMLQVYNGDKNVFVSLDCERADILTPL